MKIGYFCNSTNWGNKKTYNQILEEIREIATYCDQNDWDSIWFSEHHFSHEGMEICPNPILLSSDIAARTKNIRIGQAASIITFWNPIRAAEDIALLDQLSNGRVEAGVGRGIYGREALNMNADADMKDQAKNFRLFEETLTIIKKAWTEKFFNHQGEFYTYPAPNFEWEHDMSPPDSEFMNLDTKILEKINIVPQPVQKPHPPLWQVVDSPSSIDGLQRVGLNKYFKEKQIYSFDMVKNPKPDPDIYLKAIDDNNLIKNQTIIIEDSAVGVMAGAAAGVKVIGLTAGGHWHEKRDEKELLEAGAFAVTNDYKKIFELIESN